MVYNPVIWFICHWWQIVQQRLATPDYGINHSLGFMSFLVNTFWLSLYVMYCVFYCPRMNTFVAYVVAVLLIIPKHIDIVPEGFVGLDGDQLK